MASVKSLGMQLQLPHLEQPKQGGLVSTRIRLLVPVKKGSGPDPNGRD